MNLRNFSLGINTLPGTSPGSNHTTAQDVVNLRVDEDGYLRPTPEIIRERRTSARCTGIAAAHDHVFYLLENGHLYKQAETDTGGPTLIAGATQLRGKLSIIEDFETYFLITSEGDDPGYYYEVDSEKLIPLSLEATRTPNFTVYWGNASTNPDPNTRLQPGDSTHTPGFFFYLFAETNENLNPEEVVFLSPLTDSLLIGLRGPAEWNVRFHNLTFNNPTTTHIYVYRSPKIDSTLDYDPILTAADGINLFGKGAFRRIGFVARGTTVFWDDNDIGDTDYTPPNADATQWDDPDIENTLAPAQVLNGIPDNTKAWTYFNGYTFAATGNRLRFSDVEFGVLKPGIFPPDHSINAPGDTDFAITYDDTLVFGDSKHLNVLRGYDPYNYQVYEVASVGAVSAYAVGVLPSGQLGFISEFGFYAYDGQQVQDISSPQLEGFFENKVANDGFITPIANGDSIWSVIFLDGTRLTFLLNTDRLDAPVWTRLTAQIDQSAPWRVHSTQEWTFRNDDYWTFRDDGYWTFEDEEETYEQILFVNNQYDISEYLYHDQTSVDNTDWTWKSNRLRGGSETNKVFDRLKLAGYAENAIDVTFDLDIQGDNVQKSVTGESFAKKKRKKRIPIKRRGHACEFTISGTGDVVLREVELDSRIVGRV